MSMQNSKVIRSALFVPGDRPERFQKAVESQADVVIVDFEDAVEESRKRDARDNLEKFLIGRPEMTLVVRINQSAHQEHEADLEFCALFSQISAVILPKAESRTQIDRIGKTGKRVWPLIESATGVTQIAEIAKCHGTERLTYGALDLAVDLGLNASTPSAQRMFDQVRFAILLATAQEKLGTPLETVYPDIGDLTGLQTFAKNALDMGMGGMLCIHPSQAAIANEAFSATEQELKWAERVMAASVESPAAFRLDGKMVDAPVIAYAKKILQTSRCST